MNILAIESSCDETSASVVRDGRNVLSCVIYSQIDLHKIYGGVVPEIASRSHIEKINQVIGSALEKAGCTLLKDDEDAGDPIDAIAVTKGPGLVGPLLVGVSAAKAIAFAADLPLIGVHHIDAHISAAYIEHPDLRPPFTALVASGGHAHLVEVKDYGKYEILGRTRDDAPGEAFDKAARALGLPYPGGPAIEAAALSGNSDAIHFPRSNMEENPFDFSFSGLKSAVLNYLNGAKMKGEEVSVPDVAASFQKAVIDVLTEHSLMAAKYLGTDKLILAGGVAANKTLRQAMKDACESSGIGFYTPSPLYCTDNAAMVGCAGYYSYQRGTRDGWDMNAHARLDI